jgi:hypothetical protein
LISFAEVLAAVLAHTGVTRTNIGYGIGRRKKSVVNTPLAVVGGLAVLASALAAPAHAQQIGTASVARASEGSEAFRLTEDVLRSLVWARSASEALLNDETAGPVKLSLVSTAVEHEAIVNLRKASSFLAPHAASQRQEIRNAAAAMALVYDLLLNAFEGSLAIEGRLGDAAANTDLEPLFRDAGSCAIAGERAWRLLPIAIAVLSDALVDGARSGSDGRAAYLTVTRRETDELLEQIELFFGREAAVGRNGGLHPTASSAALLADFLREPWRGSDKN